MHHKIQLPFLYSPIKKFLSFKAAPLQCFSLIYILPHYELDVNFKNCKYYYKNFKYKENIVLINTM